MSQEGIVSEEEDGLLEGGVIAIMEGGDDEFVEDWIGQDVDQEYFLLGDGEAEEVDGDLVGGGVQDRGHLRWRGTMLWGGGHLISLPARVSLVVIRPFPHLLPIRGSVL